jgi:HAD superfamily hydrolase (TIGR01509 family)
MREGVNVIGPNRAVVFDLDGVIWDGEPLYAEAFNVVLKPYGHAIEITDPDYVQIIGKSVEAAWHWMRARFALTESPAVFYRAYNEAVLELMKQPLEPIPNVRALLSELRRRGIPVGLASASLRQWVDATLEGLNLEDAFDATVSASEVHQSKPAPDLYLTAAKRLGVPPDLCLAIEDTASGIASAKAAGMLAVQIRAASTAMPPLPEADFVFEDYSHFDFSLLVAPVSDGTSA